MLTLTSYRLLIVSHVVPFVGAMIQRSYCDEQRDSIVRRRFAKQLTSYPSLSDAAIGRSKANFILLLTARLKAWQALESRNIMTHLFALGIATSGIWEFMEAAKGLVAVTFPKRARNRGIQKFKIQKDYMYVSWRESPHSSLQTRCRREWKIRHTR